jgi:hypothetical protein
MYALYGNTYTMQHQQWEEKLELVFRAMLSACTPLPTKYRLKVYRNTYQWCILEHLRAEFFDQDFDVLKKMYNRMTGDTFVLEEN